MPTLTDILAERAPRSAPAADTSIADMLRGLISAPSPLGNPQAAPSAGADPSLLDVGRAFFRSRVEDTSVSDVLDRQRTQRLAEAERTRQGQRQQFSDTLDLANFQIDLVKTAAAQGNTEARALFDIWKEVTKDLSPEHAADAWMTADALEEDVTSGNALSVLSRIVREKRYPTAPKEATPRRVGDTREVQMGREKVTQEWTGTGWRELGRGALDAPGGSVTSAQQANNVEVASARERLRAYAEHRQPGESLRDVIRRLSERKSDTGRDNPHFDPFASRDFRTATQRMVGDDPEFDTFMQYLDSTAPTLPASVEPQATNTGPGFLGRLFGGKDEPAATTGPRPQRGASGSYEVAPAPAMGGPASTAASRVPPAYKARLDRGETLSEKELRGLFASDPKTFAAISDYLRAMAGQ